MDQTVPPNIYEWQVLPFGTTCSPCCAIYALQTHSHGHKEENPDVYRSVATAFYVDNCLDSVPTAAEAKELVHDMSALLDKGGFHLRQWISNIPSVVADLPTEDQAANCERWLSLGEAGLTEGTLGLQWQCDSDVLGYRVKEISHDCLTMKVIYRILASQYGPLGYLTPFTARAKVIVQDLWKLKRDWDAPIVEGSEYEKWCSWENELPSIENVNLPRCYTPHHVDTTNSVQQLHIFSDASERVYGAVAFLRTVYQGKVYVSFVQARSRVAPKRQLSIPRLELSAALVGAQLADMLNRELTLPIERVTLWSDSTTVLSWQKSDSCRYKVFVGTRVAEIQTLTNVADWRYVNTKDNPADDLTRGKTLEELANSSAWQNGPSFLQQSPDEWPPDIVMSSSIKDTSGEVKSTFCAVTMAESPTIPEVSKYSNWSKLVADTMQILNGAAKDTQVWFDWIKTEMFLFRKVQCDSFPEEFSALQSHKKLPTDSRLAQLDPVYDNENNVIRVGGRLRRAESLSCDAQHPVVLDPHHQITQLIIKDFDERLLHYGAERILAEIRRKFWILRGREAIRQHQRKCATCRKSRAQPQLPKMSDLPPSRLRLYKPAFYSTGVDCFGPMTIKIGRRTEKRWGVIFKCMTTRAVHLDLLDSMSTDAFLMAFRRFVARRGKPHELLSDCGSNFKGAERELRETWLTMEPSLTNQLAGCNVKFQFNPPYAPHFGGVWEREIRSVKDGLKVALGDQSVTESVLQTVLVEVEGILKSKPLGYVSTDAKDVDPITPNILLMGRRDASLPQVVYPAHELLGRKRWRHSQVLADQFWKHFVKYYLPTLQVRQKWRGDKPNHNNLECNDVVMIADPQTVRSLWQVGRVCRTYPGDDGRVRSATVLVGDQEVTRPVARLIRLPECADSDVK
ncbi:uncharacterized protein [Haliotis asinina]|uniref:uncharacterized protein n=1 Tax=Haliotis asinina TaxID=109174 RepID=UPI003531D991